MTLKKYEIIDEQGKYLLLTVGELMKGHYCKRPYCDFKNIVNSNKCKFTTYN